MQGGRPIVRYQCEQECINATSGVWERSSHANNSLRVAQRGSFSCFSILGSQSLEYVSGTWWWGGGGREVTVLQQLTIALQQAALHQWRGAAWSPIPLVPLNIFCVPSIKCHAPFCSLFDCVTREIFSNGPRTLPLSNVTCVLRRLLIF